MKFFWPNQPKKTFRHDWSNIFHTTDSCYRMTHNVTKTTQSFNCFVLDFCWVGHSSLVMWEAEQRFLSIQKWQCNAGSNRFLTNGLRAYKWILDCGSIGTGRKMHTDKLRRQPQPGNANLSFLRWVGTAHVEFRGLAGVRSERSVGRGSSNIPPFDAHNWQTPSTGDLCLSPDRVFAERERVEIRSWPLPLTGVIWASTVHLGGS